MGFPYSEADWAVVDGAMFMGAGGAMTGIYTAITIVGSIILLWKCNRVEQSLYESSEN
ncbi:MAG: hypothetical protein OXI81_12225 [Paracoccaceae bacterium]|nr:hypothetical protein [Paracoccaceae bacterium]MDE2912594.1 hypothetical protein [Paracoccaceae bacterium]